MTYELDDSKKGDTFKNYLVSLQDLMQQAGCSKKDQLEHIYCHSIMLDDVA